MSDSDYSSPQTRAADAADDDSVDPETGLTRITRRRFDPPGSLHTLPDGSMPTAVPHPSVDFSVPKGQVSMHPTQTIEYLADLLLLDRGSFFWHVLMLVPRADVDNLNKLRVAWPWITRAYERWHDSADGDVDVADILEARDR